MQLQKERNWVLERISTTLGSSWDYEPSIYDGTKLSRWCSAKESAYVDCANEGGSRDMGSLPGSGRPTVGGNGNPLQYSCLENSMDRGSWQATVHGVAKN